jgi:hypothetical protein
MYALKTFILSLITHSGFFSMDEEFCVYAV